MFIYMRFEYIYIYKNTEICLFNDRRSENMENTRYNFNYRKWDATRFNNVEKEWKKKKIYQIGLLYSLHM